MKREKMIKESMQAMGYNEKKRRSDRKKMAKQRRKSVKTRKDGVGFRGLERKGIEVR
jgi:hypothetical protein